MQFKPKKRLGQNFLVDRNIQNKIIAACELEGSEDVLEIGSGTGELTRLIAKKAARVIAVEIDKGLSRYLKDNLKGFSNVKVVRQDILKFNFRKYLPARRPLKIIGNIPYYITTPIIQRLLNYSSQIKAVFLTVQKEFAQRMVAPCGSKNYGAFSCFIQYYTQPQILFLIKHSCFYPQPKVDSCFLKLQIRDQPPVKAKDERLFFKVIRSAFNQRRKVLKNSLKGIIGRDKLERFFRQYRLNPNLRPEALSLGDFARLVNI